MLASALTDDEAVKLGADAAGDVPADRSEMALSGELGTSPTLRDFLRQTCGASAGLDRRRETMRDGSGQGGIASERWRCT
jgi:hypothetical protein